MADPGKARGAGQGGQVGRAGQEPDDSGGRRRGPRPADQDTRALILDTARAEFARKGYDATSLRGIARAAGVDPALLHHYFSGKGGLFAEIVAFPVDVAALVARLSEGPTADLGSRLVRTFLGVWDASEGREGFLALVRSATSHEESAELLRQFVTRELLGALAGGSPAPDPELRASLAAAQLIGLAMIRYVVKVEPLVGATQEQLVALIGPVLQSYLAPDTELGS